MELYKRENGIFSLVHSKNYGEKVYRDHSITQDLSVMGLVTFSESYIITGLDEETQNINYEFDDGMVRIAVSDDGQYLAASDIDSIVSIFVDCDYEKTG